MLRIYSACVPTARRILKYATLRNLTSAREYSSYAKYVAPFALGSTTISREIPGKQELAVCMLTQVEPAKLGASGRTC